MWLAVFILVLTALVYTPIPESVLHALKFLIISIICVLLVFVSAASAQQPPYHHIPNRVLTPGDIASTDVDVICQKDYPAKSRRVSNSLREKVYTLHKVQKSQCRGDCKIDHLVPLAIGGSNDIKNLWAHEYGADYSVHEKTRLEVLMRKKVCTEGMPIQQAQACFVWDWTQCYEFFYPGQNLKRRGLQ